MRIFRYVALVYFITFSAANSLGMKIKVEITNTGSSENKVKILSPRRAFIKQCCGYKACRYRYPHFSLTPTITKSTTNQISSTSLPVTKRYKLYITPTVLLPTVVAAKSWLKYWKTAKTTDISVFIPWKVPTEYDLNELRNDPKNLENNPTMRYKKVTKQPRLKKSTKEMEREYDYSTVITENLDDANIEPSNEGDENVSTILNELTVSNNDKKKTTYVTEQSNTDNLATTKFKTQNTNNKNKNINSKKFTTRLNRVIDNRKKNLTTSVKMSTEIPQMTASYMYQSITKNDLFTVSENYKVSTNTLSLKTEFRTSLLVTSTSISKPSLDIFVTPTDTTAVIIKTTLQKIEVGEFSITSPFENVKDYVFSETFTISSLQTTFSTSTSRITTLNKLTSEIVTTIFFISTTTATITTCSPVCNTIICAIDNTKVNSNGVVNVPFTMGVALDICERYYYISLEMKNFTEAQLQCCKFGMTLVAMESNEEGSCMAELHKKFIGSENEFWTSGSNLGCKEKWSWCSTNKLIANYITWSEGEPYNPEQQNCLSVILTVTSPARALLKTSKCTETKNFACEADKKNAPFNPMELLNAFG